MAPRHQTEISADVAGSPEAFGIINCRCEREGRELPDTGNAHQPAARIGRSDHPCYVAIDRHDGGEHGGTRADQTSHGGGQSGDAVTRLQRLLDEGGIECAWQSDPEHYGKAADLVFQSDALPD